MGALAARFRTRGADGRNSAVSGAHAVGQGQVTARPRDGAHHFLMVIRVQDSFARSLQDPPDGVGTGLVSGREQFAVNPVGVLSGNPFDQPDDRRTDGWTAAPVWMGPLRHQQLDVLGR